MRSWMGLPNMDDSMNYEDKNEVELLGEKYLVYIKKVPSSLDKGSIKSTTMRAFIRKIKS